MDTFIEQIVVKRKTMGEVVMQTAVWFFGVLAILILLFLSIGGGNAIVRMVALLAAFGIGYGMWYLLTSMKVEFEYSVTNGHFDIDKIIAQRRRKRLLSAEVSEIESFSKYNAEAQAHRNYDKRLMVGGGGKYDLWCAELRHKELGHILVVFEPDDRTLATVRKFLPKMVERDAFGRN